MSSGIGESSVDRLGSNHLQCIELPSCNGRGSEEPLNIPRFASGHCGLLQQAARSTYTNDDSSVNVSYFHRSNLQDAMHWGHIAQIHLKFRVILVTQQRGHLAPLWKEPAPHVHPRAAEFPCIEAHCVSGVVLYFSTRWLRLQQAMLSKA